ncbi:uroporphyrinogen-III synthase [Chitinophaga jiangningensis]|uniref:Uroporphyrinogen-III synthase n=1 Tax=Chitinophaga jiangningensis TaxID=1419482 RepID=A0A1M7MFD3_9BACT|nr:uroporphyrinogen-III synthase [Chitinophaga jiangningensis]SHM89525.1 uroporphyrinogen-III synthase [Chitinophaga jiangningensis]
MPNDPYRILCTRPIPASLIADAAGYGIDIQVKEFIQISPIPVPELHQHVFSENTPMVFTSAHAVNILKEMTGTAIISNSICCISGNTRTAAEQAFPQSPIIAAAPYGIELAQAIIQRGNIKAVNFFCGNIHRKELPEALTSAGIRVNEFVIYRNDPMPEKVTGHYNGIFFFSPSAVNSYFSANSIPADTVCFAIGTTTAAALKEATNNKIIMSTDVDANSMVQTAITYFNNNNI